VLSYVLNLSGMRAAVRHRRASGKQLCAVCIRTRSCNARHRNHARSRSQHSIVAALRWATNRIRQYSLQTSKQLQSRPRRQQWWMFFNLTQSTCSHRD